MAEQLVSAVNQVYVQLVPPRSTLYDLRHVDQLVSVSDGVPGPHSFIA